MLLIRVTEAATGDTWRNLRHELDRLHLITLAIPDGQLAQRAAAPMLDVARDIASPDANEVQVDEQPAVRRQPLGQ